MKPRSEWLGVLAWEASGDGLNSWVRHITTGDWVHPAYALLPGYCMCLPCYAYSTYESPFRWQPQSSASHPLVTSLEKSQVPDKMGNTPLHLSAKGGFNEFARASWAPLRSDDHFPELWERSRQVGIDSWGTRRGIDDRIQNPIDPSGNSAMVLPYASHNGTGLLTTPGTWSLLRDRRLSWLLSNFGGAPVAIRLVTSCCDPFLGSTSPKNYHSFGDRAVR